MTLPAVILAGGRATRIGGGDKGLLMLIPDAAQGRLLDHVIARLAPQVGAMALNANGDPARLAGFGLPVLQDGLPDHPGPLAGILAAMDWAAGQGAASVVTVPADTPFLPRDLVVRLQAAAAPRACGLAVAATRDRDGTVRVHPVCGLWPVALRGDLRATLLDGQRKATHWTTRHGAALALFAVDDAASSVDPFFNINTPDDLKRARALLGQADDMPAPGGAP